MEERVKFSLIIGDRSDDGHCQKQIYYYSTAKTLQDARNAHFLIKEKTGIDVTKICSNYGDSTLPEEVSDKLVELGFEHLENYGEDEVWIDSDTMSKIYKFLLNHVDDSLDIKSERNMIPCIQATTYEDRRYIDSIGYGLFGY